LFSLGKLFREEVQASLVVMDWCNGLKRSSGADDDSEEGKLHVDDCLDRKMCVNGGNAD